MEGNVAYIRFTVHTSQENSETEVTSEELGFRGRYLKKEKKVHTTMISTQKRRFTEISGTSTSYSAATPNYTCRQLSY